MRRRHFHHALTGLALVPLSLPAWAQSRPAASPPEEDPLLNGVKFVLEMATTHAMDRNADRWPETALYHLKDSWADWVRYGGPKLSEGSPWTRYEAFESLARFAMRRIWQFAKDSLLVQVHTLDATDLQKLRDAAAQKLANGYWATAVFELKAGDRLLHRLLGSVVELHLAWLLENRDRYPRNPAARHAQIEAEDWEICLRITRSLVFAIFDAIAEQERQLRLDPTLAGKAPNVVAALAFLGPPPAEPMPRDRPNRPGRDKKKPT